MADELPYRKKRPTEDDGPSGAVPLYEPEGYRLGMSESGRATYDKNADDVGPLERMAQQSAGKSSGPYERVGLAGTKPTKSSFALPAPERKMTPDEMMKKAEEMLAMNEAKHSASLDLGPSASTDEERNAAPWLREYMRKQR